ncbi:MAG: ABC transporter permease, partial [Pseudomonadota bacterium]
LAYGIIALLGATGVIGDGWALISGTPFEGPSGAHPFGTNRNGMDILARGLYATRTAFEVGLVVAIGTILLSALLGGLAGYMAGSLFDEVVLWMKGVIDSIPFFLLVAAIAWALPDDFAYAMHVAMISTFWTTGARLVRGEALRLREREYVQAARGLGASRARVVWQHVLPNTAHILLVQGTLVFVAAIKSEVILSFLGLGMKDGMSWGVMLGEAAGEVAQGHYANLLSASLLMFGLVLAVSLLADALQDATDPHSARDVR